MSKRLLRDVEVAEATNIPVQTLRHYRSKGGGPDYYKFAGARGAVRYDLDVVYEWLETNRVSSTSEYGSREVIRDQVEELEDQVEEHDRPELPRQHRGEAA